LVTEPSGELRISEGEGEGDGAEMGGMRRRGL